MQAGCNHLCQLNLLSAQLIEGLPVILRVPANKVVRVECCFYHRVGSYMLNTSFESLELLLGWDRVTEEDHGRYAFGVWLLRRISER